MADKLWRKSRQQPLVPLGIILTFGALTLAGKAIRDGDSRLANRMFYWRVGLQGLTVAALIGGAYYYEETASKVYNRQEELNKLSKEREKLWIEELERVDEAAKARKAKALSFHEQFLQKREESKRAELAKKQAEESESTK